MSSDEIFYDSLSEISNDSTNVDILDFSQIELLPHQKQVIRYIVSKCRKQHGLLINHFQGTGKTITGVFFLKNYETRKKIILAPSALKSMWQKACKDQGLTNNIFFVTYEYLDEITQDEDNDNDNEKIKKIQDLFNNSILVCDESHNILQKLDYLHQDSSVVLNNIAGINNPKNRRQMIEDNKFIKTAQQKLKDFLEIFNKTKKCIFLTGTPVTDNITSIRWFINLSAGKTVVPYNSNEFSKKYLLKSVYSSISEKLTPLLNVFNLQDIDVRYISDYKENITQTINNTMISFTGNIIIDQFIKNLITSSVVTTVDTLYNKFSYEKLDIKDIDWGKYVSFYKYSNLEYYPTMNIIKKPVNYTEEQYSIINRINGKLTSNEMVLLNFYETLFDAQLFKTDNINIYDNRFRIIGNLYTNEYPLKFIEIVKDYFLHNTSTLVYSNFYESGILIFSKYLTKLNIHHDIFHPELTSIEKEQILQDFKEQKIKLLLLHPSYFEGFSIQGVRRFHILEPVTKFYIKEQLYTRVCRFKSHEHLPIEQRNVEIIQWYCSLKNLINKIHEAKIQISNKTLDLSILDFNGSIDDFYINSINSIESKLNGLSHVLKSISIDNNDIFNNLDDTCCIYGDTCDENLKSCVEI